VAIAGIIDIKLAVRTPNDPADPETGDSFRWLEQDYLGVV
jgi:hypothetical protein